MKGKNIVKTKLHFLFWPPYLECMYISKFAVMIYACRFSNMDCSAVKCGANESLWTKMLRRKEKF